MDLYDEDEFPSGAQPPIKPVSVDGSSYAESSASRLDEVSAKQNKAAEGESDSFS